MKALAPAAVSPAIILQSKEEFYSIFMSNLDARAFGAKHGLFLTWHYMSKSCEGMEPFDEWFVVSIEAFAA
jgi:hypothetical protein